MGKYNRNATTNLHYMIFDFIFSLIAFLISTIICGGVSNFFTIEYLLTWLVFAFVYIMVAKNYALYRVTTFFYIDRTILFIVKSYITATALITVTLFLIGNCDINVRFYIIFLSVNFLCILVSTFLTRIIIKNSNSDRMAPRTLLVGNPQNFQRFCHFINRSNMNVNIIGYVYDKDEDTISEGYIGVLDDLETIIHDNAIDQVFFQSLNEYNEKLGKYIDLCLSIGVTAKVILFPYNLGGMQSYIYSVGTYPVVTYHNVNQNIYSRAIKRTIDIIGSLFGIILSSPIMIATAIAIKLDSKGPVIFKQVRIGQNGRQFYMYKFRSMCVDAEERKKELLKKNKIEGGQMFKMDDDPRITKVGKLIRKTSIDELPQFFNVLHGDMSLVGTRPPTLDEVALYETNQWRRLSIRPGITGMWQVSGRSTITDFDEVVRLDTEYIDNWNIFLDFRIMIKTVLQIFNKNKGAM